MSVSGITRRELVRRGGLLALPVLLKGRVAAAEPFGATAAPAPAGALPGLRVGPEIYQSIGVRPFVNARGTYTILTGSTMLPEPRAAMDAASRHYVHLDELAEAIGKRLAELTQAEWGMVTTGCSAALTHATAACVTGGNPDLHVRVPDLRGFPRDECIIPKHSRNVYDAAVRAVGVKVVEVATAEELEAAFGPRTALIYILAGPNADEGPLSTKALCEAAKKRGVPVRRGLRGRDPHRAERPPAARRRPRHVQRRQVPARPAGRRPPPRPQGPREGRLGGQRAPPRLRPRVQGRQGRGDGDAGGRRGVDEARLRGRDPGVGLVARHDREAPRPDRRRHHLGDAGRGALEPHARPPDPLGPGEAGDDRRGGGEAALRERAAHLALPRAGSGRTGARPASPSART